MGKPMGIYVTMEAPAMVEPDDGYHREISCCLDLIHPLTVVGGLSILLHNMPGDKQVVHHLGPQGVGRHLPVAQTHHQNRLLLFNFLGECEELWKIFR